MTPPLTPDDRILPKWRWRLGSMGLNGEKYKLKGES
jgi:hypothetical protein